MKFGDMGSSHENKQECYQLKLSLKMLVVLKKINSSSGIGYIIKVSIPFINSCMHIFKNTHVNL